MEAKTPKRLWWWQYWPCALAGLGVPLTVFLARWLPRHFAAGVGFFVTWFVVGLLLARYFPPKWGLPAWIGAFASAVAAGLAGGLIAYLIHWP
jgi:hypothetical protein